MTTPKERPRSPEEVSVLVEQVLALNEPDTMRFWASLKTQAESKGREVVLIYRHPEPDEIRRWANSALRNSEIHFLDEDFVRDFADGLPALMVK